MCVQFATAGPMLLAQAICQSRPIDHKQRSDWVCSTYSVKLLVEWRAPPLPVPHPAIPYITIARPRPRQKGVIISWVQS